jgi:tape measure domain-containing protein
MDNIQLAAYLKDEVSPTLSNISKHIDKMEKEFQKAGTASERAGKKIKQSSNTAADAVNNWAKGLAVGAVAMQAFNVASDAVVQAGKWEKFSKALASMEGGVTAGNKAMERLIELSKMPGLGLEEVNGAYLRLRAVGMQAGEAERTIRAFGNAIASSGGGAEEFGRVSIQLAQMANKSKLLAEDIGIMQESMPNLSMLMKQAFGTSNLENIRNMGVGAKEFIQRITEMAEKMPQATAGINDAMDDLNTSWSRFKAGFVNAEWMKGALSATSDFLSRLTKIMEDSNTKINKMELFKAFMTGGIGGAAGVIAGGGGTIDTSDMGRLMTAMQDRLIKIEEEKRYMERFNIKESARLNKLLKEQATDYKNYRIRVKKKEDDAAKLADETGLGGGYGDGAGTTKSKVEKSGPVGYQGEVADLNYKTPPKSSLALGIEALNAQPATPQADPMGASLEAMAAQAKAFREKIEQETTAYWENAIGSFMQNTASSAEGILTQSFFNIGVKGKNLYDDLSEGFTAMLGQMAAQMAAKAFIFGLFNLFSGGAGFGGVGKSGSFFSTILGGASASTGAVPSLSPVASAGGGVNLTVNLSGGATKRDATTIANTLAAAQRGRLVGAMA